MINTPDRKLAPLDHVQQYILSLLVRSLMPRTHDYGNLPTPPQRVLRGNATRQAIFVPKERGRNASTLHQYGPRWRWRGCRDCLPCDFLSIDVLAIRLAEARNFAGFFDAVFEDET
jgi:hypothetical protein